MGPTLAPWTLLSGPEPQWINGTWKVVASSMKYTPVSKWCHLLLPFSSVSGKKTTPWRFTSLYWGRLCSPHPLLFSGYYPMGGMNTLRPRRNGRHLSDGILKCIFLNENMQTLLNISLKFVPNGLLNDIPALVQIMACHLVGDKPLSEPMMILLTHICITRPKWVNEIRFHWLAIYPIPNHYV